MIQSENHSNKENIRGLFKENVWILDKIMFGLKKQEHEHNNKLKLSIQ
jgi:hypothetical protein